ncbi:MAG: glutathione S-transferase family protein [Alphaproteobacteria bacterium]|nr:glutathione S-transferase family protein [Alphaproteobacteria bacterium]
MRLFISPISPYVRKVEIIAHLKGLGDRLEKVKARDVGVDIAALNPLATARRHILQQEALAQGVLDAAVACRMEVREHGPEQQSAAWLERQHQKLVAGLREIEKNLAHLPEPLGLLQASYACALFFIDQHKVYVSWRTDYPHLAQWYAKLRQVPLIAKTEPKL